jgi:hypothetical protein
MWDDDVEYLCSFAYQRVIDVLQKGFFALPLARQAELLEGKVHPS